jgi:hypothetical protein
MVKVLGETSDLLSLLLQYRELLILSLEKCLVGLQNFFENPFSFTLLHFLVSQIKTLSHTIKCIEKQDTTTMKLPNC